MCDPKVLGSTPSRDNAIYNTVIDSFHSEVDLVGGHSLMHYDSVRAFSFSECKIQTVI